MLVIVTYEENGGFWLHVPSQIGAGIGRSLGAGGRVSPTPVISPCAERSHVGKTAYDTTSILKLVTTRFNRSQWPMMQNTQITH
jgi:hypothetical protein